MGLDALRSWVGEGDMRDPLDINVGVLLSALVGERGVDASGRDLDSVRVCVGARTVDADEGEGAVGRKRALLAAVGCIKVELRMKGMVGLFFVGCGWDG